MKYMGSKRIMLLNGLGSILSEEITSAKRFVDLFVGSGAVAIHVAQKYSVPVLAYDLQMYSTVLANAVISRKSLIDWEPVWKSWYSRAEKVYSSKRPLEASKITQAIVKDFRYYCIRQESPITRAYGGHYFSPSQALWIDALRSTLPSDENAQTVALAALISAASQCAASPGHTAQPLQPTKSAKKFLNAAWNTDVVEKTKTAFEAISKQCAKGTGKAAVADANEAAKQLQKGDLVFIDPPYSGVHYSRFYHVLETIAQGKCGKVTGVGRYPDPELRPKSKYSLQTESSNALDELLSTISAKKAKAILTFPDHPCSNGLSGNKVKRIAKKYFDVRQRTVKSKFSTLGGRAEAEREIRKKEGKKDHGRQARMNAKELILVLTPRD